VLAARASDVWVAFATSDAAAESIIKRTLVRSEDLALARDAGLSTEEIEGLETILTAREREVLKHVRRGLTNSAIASELFISESTVKVHVHHILEKLNVKTRLQAALKTAESDSSNAG
jgi:DNA-binding NarL/FixJ family response regulator